MTEVMTPSWYKLDLGASFVEVKSMKLKMNALLGGTLDFEGSNTGSFSGEETVILDGSAGDWGTGHVVDSNGAYNFG